MSDERHAGPESGYQATDLEEDALASLGPRFLQALGLKEAGRVDDAEEALVEVVGLDGLRRHRRRRDVVDEDRACDKPCWGLDDFEDDYPPACAECPIS